MGVSTDAYLYYGFDVFDGDAGYGFDVFDGEIGLDLLPSDNEYLNNDESEEEGYARMGIFLENLVEKTKEKAEEKGVDVSGIDFDTHRSNEYPVYFIHGDFYELASRGNPEQINLEDLSPDKIKKMDENIRNFCEISGIKYQQPKLMLASYWG